MFPLRSLGFLANMIVFFHDWSLIQRVAALAPSAHPLFSQLEMLQSEYLSATLELLTYHSVTAIVEQENRQGLPAKKEDTQWFQLSDLHTPASRPHIMPTVLQDMDKSQLLGLRLHGQPLDNTEHGWPDMPGVHGDQELYWAAPRRGRFQRFRRCA